MTINITINTFTPCDCMRKLNPMIWRKKENVHFMHNFVAYYMYVAMGHIQFFQYPFLPLNSLEII